MQFVAVLAFLAITANFCLAQDGDGVVLPNAEEADEEFQKSLTTERQRPKEDLTDEEINRLAGELKSGGYESYVEERVEGDVTRVTDRDELIATADVQSINNLYVQYFQQSKVFFAETFNDCFCSHRCCPRSQNYQCKEIYTPLSPFYQWPLGWCTPINNVNIATCNCNKCFAQCPDCINQGKCLRKYKHVSFFAVCRFWWWSHVVLFTKYLPYSCYCTAGC